MISNTSVRGRAIGLATGLAAALTLALSSAPVQAQTSIMPIIIGQAVANSMNRSCTRTDTPPQAFRDEVTPLLDAALKNYLEASLTGDPRTARSHTRNPGNRWGLDNVRHPISSRFSLDGVVEPGVVPELVRDTLIFSNERVTMRGRWRVITTDPEAPPVYLRVDFVQGFWSGWKVRNVRITHSDDLSMMPDEHCSSGDLPPL